MWSVMVVGVLGLLGNFYRFLTLVKGGGIVQICFFNVSAENGVLFLAYGKCVL